ncbi:MAG: hypothetical protein ACE14P_07350 [Methanotrichaceae archaeon]
MFSEKDLVARSIEDMALEVKDLLAESVRLRAEYEESLQREERLRRESVEARAENPALAETLWLEAEQLRTDYRELLRQSVEKRLHAAEIQHRINIRSQIEAMDNSYDEIWEKASRARRI